ncbi:hypothetical protein EDC45_1211 [Mesocricetibacter intestinalis]|uniref:N-acetyltransferase domain-containing protein n=1 Tax=Mesocricetibacter intestinalis TaxID=1521930 RepID=A0A4R6V983_9PAST|nr:GNAT family N-acetyltransferase [Mesocricetibacter intestinalis]TDQ58138.1 hypothetical protein EDC45_1211 [Mesocricetibacter intestinalis]
MYIQHKQEGEQGKFAYLDAEGKEIAVLSYYFVDGRTINAHHTYVPAAFRGQGLADGLYRALRDFVREKDLKLIPSCSYIAAKWQREQA